MFLHVFGSFGSSVVIRGSCITSRCGMQRGTPKQRSMNGMSPLYAIPVAVVNYDGEECNGTVRALLSSSFIASV